MEWRRYGYVLKQALPEEESVGLRRFGTELTSNIFNQQNTRAQKFNQRGRKRAFKQLDAERKEEEHGECVELQRPLKRARYNFRSRKHEKADDAAIAGKENHVSFSKPSKFALITKAKSSKQGEKTMDIDSTESEDEDIDLIGHKHKKQHQQSSPVQNKANRHLPVRRSLRLQKKRERKLREEQEAKRRQTEPREEQEDEKSHEQDEYEDDDDRAEPEYIVDEEVLNCDAIHVDDDLFVVDYVSDITQWYLECEAMPFQRELILNNYISSSFQKDLNDSMRCILLDWLLNVHRRFKLSESTLFLGVYILDAYLSLVPIKRDKLQMIGCCALWIASKYHEIYAPEANDFVYISDHSFSIQTLFETEIAILTKLQFRFANIMTPLHFMQRYLQITVFPLWKKYESRNTVKARRDGEKYIYLVEDIAAYFAELALFDCKLISMEKPSKIAAASVCFAILSIALYSKWPEFLEKATGYNYKQLRPVLIRLNNIREYTNKHAKLTAVMKRHKGNMEWIEKLNIKRAICNA